MDASNCSEILGGLKVIAIKINTVTASGGTADPTDTQIMNILLGAYARNCQSQAPRRPRVGRVALGDG